MEGKVQLTNAEDFSVRSPHEILAYGTIQQSIDSILSHAKHEQH
jgi:hypothetical protein